MNRCEICLARRSSMPLLRESMQARCIVREELTVFCQSIKNIFVVCWICIVVFRSIKPIFRDVKVDAVITRLGYPKPVVLQRLFGGRC